MKHFFAKLLLICLPLTLFSGCKKQTPDLPNIASRIEISCQHKDVLVQRNYTDQDKMQAVLIYLRLLKPQGIAQADPLSLQKDVFEINIHLFDGQIHNYKQTGHRFFKKGHQVWKNISQDEAVRLYQILLKYESDTV